MDKILRLLGLKKDRFLGIATAKRRYDLPLDRNAGNKFVKILVGLMTVLLMLSLSGAFALSGLAERWSSGLEGKASVEIPAKDINGILLPQEDIKTATQKIALMLEDDKTIETVTVLSEAEIIALISPWLGDDIDTQTTPFPGIISLTFYKQADINKAALITNIQHIAPQARLDTHESWLNDVLRLTNSLRFAAYVIVLVIGLTTIVAIAGAVRARLSAYKEDLELLHLMGAQDNYIARQLQRHTMILALQGSFLGFVFGLILLGIMAWLLSSKDLTLIPEFTLDGGQKIILFLIPIIISVMAMGTARLTVLRTLKQLP
ncbi:MAG: permease [Alphaproteobacteria bacterium]|nr:permease [Alphaproteobacteria bacterium]NCQ87835.1 permease [Alphaproteobacteria bacterium]NCT05657.1 permease [Alphaproteobacteria bacterium]